MRIRPWILIAFCFAAVGCTAGPNSLIGTNDAYGHVAGFWLGAWHGSITFVTFVFSLFDNHVQIYEVHNNGCLYNLGFLLGLGTVVRAVLFFVKTLAAILLDLL